MSLPGVLREVQYSKLYSWDSFTDPSCAESWENTPGQCESFFCLEIHISLGRYIHVTDINQDFKCKKLFAGPFGCSQCVFLYLCASSWGNLLYSLAEFLPNEQSCHWPHCPFSSRFIQANNPVQSEMKAGKFLSVTWSLATNRLHVDPRSENQQLLMFSGVRKFCTFSWVKWLFCMCCCAISKRIGFL